MFVAKIRVAVIRVLEGDFSGADLNECVANAVMEARNHGEIETLNVQVLDSESTDKDERQLELEKMRSED